MQLAKELDIETFKSLFVYDETSPSGLRWKVDRRSFNLIKAGDVAGCIYHPSNGTTLAWRIRFGGEAYLAHRVVYLLNNGSICRTKVIDHIDGNPLNNKLENLRLTTSSENSKNKTSLTQHISYYKASATYSERYLIRWRDKNNIRRSKTICINKSRTKDEALELATALRDSLIQQGLIQTRLKINNNNKGVQNAK